MRQISEHLFRHESTCCVYVIVSGADAVLIDFGDGSVMDALASIGVSRVTDVLMTHHHRDQGQGLARAVEAGTRVWVPQAEQELFGDIDVYWQAREIYNNYNVRQDRFSLLHSIPVAGTLEDYAEQQFAECKLTVLPTPGHTPGSVSLLATIDGGRCIFTGDLIAAPGKVWSLAATQWSYHGAEGAAASIASLLDLKARVPDLLLPSHGEPITWPASAIDLLVERLWELLCLRADSKRLMSWIEKPYVEITRHLLLNRASTANSYVLLSESGKALLIDYGYDMNTGLPEGTDRAARRPWLYTLPALKRDFGVTKIDVALATHYHDDHVAGFNLLRRVEGTEVWAAENFARILQSPSDYDLPCLWYDPIPVDRVLPFDRPVTWEEFELRLYPLPGHTLYAAAIAFDVNGYRVLAAGDQYYGNDGLGWNYVYKNKYRPGAFARTARLYREISPDLILSGHWAPLWVKPGHFDRLEERGEALARLHRELLPEDTGHFDPEGYGAFIRPYQTEARAGDEIHFEVELRNPFATEQPVTVRLDVPAEWKLNESENRMRLGPHEIGVARFAVQLPDSIAFRRARVAADVTVGERRLGEQAEALVSAVC